MNKNQGFTLIELLVVVLIVGILSAVALPQYQKAVLKSRYMQLMTIGDAITRAEEMFYLANGKYTNELDELDLEFPTSDDFTVRLAVGTPSVGHAAVNVVSSKWGLGHIVYFAHHVGSSRRRECRVYDEKATAALHEVCKGLTGAESGGTGPGYTYYVFK